jgi:nucleoside-diphosphate-sugar epimerase
VLAWFVDVEDTARLHAIALFSPNVRSERLFAAARPISWGEVIGIIRRIQPSNSRIPAPPFQEEPTLGDVVPAGRAEKLLREYFGQRGWTSLEDSLEGGLAGEH